MAKKKESKSKESPVQSARRASVPLVAIESADPALTVRQAMKDIDKIPSDTPVGYVAWNPVYGLQSLNPRGLELVSSIMPDANPDPVLTLKAVLDYHYQKKEPVEMVLFWYDAHKLLVDPTIVHAFWLCRDGLKDKGSMIVMIAPTMVLPPELKHDVMVISEPLPDAAALGEIVDNTYQSLRDSAGVDLPELSPEVRTKCVDATLGLSGFAAEQCLSLSVSIKGFNLDTLWERKRKTIEQQPGLKVWRGGETFEQIGGCDNIKQFTREILNGRAAPAAICFLDEIEKSLAGVGGDLSGVSTDYLGALLTAQ